MEEYKNIEDFLIKTHKYNVRNKKYPWLPVLNQRPYILCKDGFSMSVQASAEHYCMPRDNKTGGKYRACEIGMISQEEELLFHYAEDIRKPTKTIYCYVPVDVIDNVIRKHGGFA